MKCSEVMKARPECVGPAVPVCEAAQQMFDENIGFLPVCDSSGVVLGTITDRDLALRIVARQRSFATPVGDVMTKESVVCRTTDDMERAKALMAEHRKSRIMCVDDQGRLAGVVSLSDIAKRGDASGTLRQIATREAHS